MQRETKGMIVDSRRTQPPQRSRLHITDSLSRSLNTSSLVKKAQQSEEGRPASTQPLYHHRELPDPQRRCLAWTATAGRRGSQVHHWAEPAINIVYTKRSRGQAFSIWKDPAHPSPGLKGRRNSMSHATGVGPADRGDVLYNGNAVGCIERSSSTLTDLETTVVCTPLIAGDHQLLPAVLRVFTWWRRPWLSGITAHSLSPIQVERRRLVECTTASPITGGETGLKKMSDASQKTSTPNIQGELATDHDVLDFIMNQPNVVPRINSRILTTTRTYLDLSSTHNHFIDEYSRFVFLDTKDKNTAVANSMNYMTKKDDGVIRPVTFWVVGDFDHPSGRHLLYDAIRHMKTSNNVRLGLINNPVESPSSSTARIARAMWAAIQTQTANNAKNFITKLAKEETAQALEEGTDVAEFAVGGQLILVMEAWTPVLSIPAKRRGPRWVRLRGRTDYSAVKIRPKEEEVYFDVVAVVDPVTRDAQKLAPLLL
ncbi:hypothetical protein NFI96_032341, partial [Prochilodus magdalenae]